MMLLIRMERKFALLELDGDVIWITRKAPEEAKPNAKTSVAQTSHI